MDPRPLIDYVESAGEHRTTRSRFWVLFVYCLLAICQACSWNVFGPIYPATYKAFPSWTPGYLNWVINSANIMFGISLYPISVGVRRWGARRTTLFCALMVSVSALVRCIPLADGPAHQTMMVLSMLCNGAGGAWLNFGGPLLSELWFPQSERTMATSLASVCAYAGGALGFLVGPALVGQPSVSTTHAAARAAMDRLFYLEAAVCVASALCCVAHFPDQPKHPPSEAAAAKRKAAALEREAATAAPRGSEEAGDADVKAAGGLRAYFSPSVGARKYWVLSIAMGIPLGVSQGWGSVLYPCLEPLDFSEQEAAWLGFLQTMAGCAASVAVGALLDRFAGRLKLVAVLVTGIATAAYTLFCANAAGYMPLSHPSSIAFAYVTAITGGCAFNISVPLLFELIMESVFGWGEEGLGSMMTVFINTAMQVFFLVVLASSDPDASKLWTAWATAGSMGICCVGLLFLRVEYRRLAIDQGTQLSETGCAFDRAVGCY